MHVAGVDDVATPNIAGAVRKLMRFTDFCIQVTPERMMPEAVCECMGALDCPQPDAASLKRWQHAHVVQVPCTWRRAKERDVVPRWRGRGNCIRRHTYPHVADDHDMMIGHVALHLANGGGDPPGTDTITHP